MKSVRGPRLRFTNLIRILHISLWLTIPTTLWLWLAFADSPDFCAPAYGQYYTDNGFCLPEDLHGLFVSGLLFVGSIVFDCWLAGYCFEITSRVIRGDRMLPQVHRGHLHQGGKLFWHSLAFWAPFIFAFICVSLIFDGVRSEFTLRATQYVVLASAAIAPVLLLGNLVGVARYAATGDRSLICQRWENIRLVLANIMASVVFSSALFVLYVVSATAISQVSFWLYDMKLSDLVAEAAIRSFACLFVLLCSIFFSSHLFALYAGWIGVGNNLNHSATHGS